MAIRIGEISFFFRGEISQPLNLEPQESGRLCGRIKKRGAFAALYDTSPAPTRPRSRSCPRGPLDTRREPLETERGGPRSLPPLGAPSWPQLARLLPTSSPTGWRRHTSTSVNQTGGKRSGLTGYRSNRSGPVPAGTQPVKIQNLNLNSKNEKFPKNS